MKGDEKMSNYGHKKPFTDNSQNPVSTLYKDNNEKVKTGFSYKEKTKFNRLIDLQSIDLKQITPIKYFNLSDVMNIKDDLSNSTVLHGGRKKMPTEPKYVKTDNVNGEVFKRLAERNFFEDIASKKQSPNTLLKRTIKYNNEANIITNKSNSSASLMNLASLNKAIEATDNVLKNGGILTAFDFETVSGINQFGHSTLSNITEIAAVQYGVENGVAKERKVINTVLGFTEKEAKDAKLKLNEIMSKDSSKWTNEEKVFYERMNIYGNSEAIQKGLDFQVVKSKGIKDIKKSKDSALKGIELLEDVAKKQTQLLKESNNMSYDEYRRTKLLEFRNLLAESNVIQGHNVVNFDISVLNKALGINEPIINPVTKQAVPILDTLQFANYSIQSQGVNSLYATNAIRKNYSTGRATQETLAEAHNLKDKNLAAHIAINDTKEHAGFVFGNIDGGNVYSDTIKISKNSYFNQVIKKNMAKINEEYKDTAALYEDSNQLFYMDYTMQKHWDTQDGALSFEYDPMTKSFKTYDGYKIENKKVSNDGFPAFGPRKGGVYQHNIYEVEVNDDFRKQFMNISGAGKEQADKIFQQYSSANKLYMVESRQYMDIESLTKKLGSRELAEHYIKNRPTTYTIETNYERLGANLGINIGKITKDGLVANKKAIEALGIKNTWFDNEGVLVESNEIVKPDILLDKLVDKSYDRTINDSAARKLRDLDYQKLIQIRNYQKELNNKGIKSNAPIIQRVSEMISQNQAIDLTKNEEIVNALGWYDWDKNTSKIAKETINSTLALESHISGLSPLLDTIEDVLNETYGELKIGTPQELNSILKDPAKREILWKKDLAFKQIYNNYLDSLVDNPKLLNNWQETYHTSSELNKLDFNTYELFPDKIGKRLNNGKRNFTNNITSIDLNNPNSLFETFYKQRFGDLDKRGITSRNSNAGFEAMKDAIEAINSDERFFIKGKGPLLKGFNVEDYRGKGIESLKNDVMDIVNSFVKTRRSDNPSFGYLNPRMNQSVLSPSAVTEYLKNVNTKDLKNTIKNISENTALDFKIIGKHSKDKAIDELVNKYFLTFSFEDMQKGMEGLTENQITFNKKQYQLAQKAARNKASTLLSAIEGTNIQLALSETDSGSMISLIQGNDIHNLSDMFKFNHRQGMMTYKIGDNDYALKMGLKYKDGKLSLSNTVDNVVDGKLDHMNAYWAEKRGDSILDAIIYNNKATNKSLRDASALISVNNGQLFAQGFHFDSNALVELLPTMKKNGTLEKLEAKYNIGDEARESIRKIINSIDGNERYFSTKSWTKILPVQLNFFSDNYLNPMLDELRMEDGIINSHAFTSEDRKILDEVGVLSKNTAATKGNLSGVSNAYIDPLAKLDNEMRPPMTQMSNNRLYNKSDVLDKVNKLKGENSKIYKDLTATSVYTSGNMEKFLYNNISSTGEAATSGLTMKYMQIDSQSLRNKFLSKDSQDKMEKFLESTIGDWGESDLERAKAVIHDRVKRMTTYEQESLMDSKVHDIAFHRTNTQTINAKRRIIEKHSDNLDVIAYTKDPHKLYFKINDDGSIEYEIGVKVKKGQKLGRFGNDDFSEIVEAKETGMFRGRFFDTHGNVVSEENLKKALKGIDTSNNKAVLDKLNSIFNFKFEVLGLEEAHGSKVMLGASEKTTIDSMKLRVGEADSKLREKLISNGMGDIVGKVVKKDYLDQVVYKELVDKFGTEEAQVIMDRINKERHLFSSAIHAVDGFEDVNFITNLNYNKHNAATALMHKGLNDLRANGQLNEENLNKIFGKGNYEIITKDGVQTIDIKQSLEDVNLAFDKDADPVLHAAFNTTNFINDGKQNIGYTGVGHVMQIYDDSAGTASGIFGDEVRGKGVKFSESMGKNLDRQTYNIDGIQKIYNHYKELGDLDEFKRIFGHALDMESIDSGELAFNKQYAGKSMATPITNRLRKQLYKSDHGPTVLDKIDDPRYRHLVASMNRDMLGEISVDKAEVMYSYLKGNEALKVNGNKNVDGLVERMTKQGDFKLLDWTGDNPDFLEFAIGKQGKTIVNSELNPYTNNLIIKTGFGGNHEYLAIARMPEKHAGDNLIQKEHIKLLREFQEKFKGIEAGTISEDTVKKHMNRFTEVMQKDISGKEGLVKEVAQNRMEQSFMGKASGIVHAGTDTIDGVKLLGSGRVDRLNKLNAEIFSKIKFNGKTWNEHYAKGAVLDTFFMGEEQFKAMGYFNEDFMNKTLSNLKEDVVREFKELNLNTQEDQMKHLLRTRGDSFVTVRYPEIMQGSDKFALGLLDDTLKHNEVRVAGPTGMSGKLDFDGDTFNAARITTSNGLSRLNAVVSNEVDSELTAMKNAFDSSVMTRAINDNSFWEHKFQQFFTDNKTGLEAMQKGFNLNEIAASKLINGKAYIGSTNKSELELQELFTKYQSVIAQQKENGLKDEALIQSIHKIGGKNEEAIHDFVAAKSWSDRRDMMTAKFYHNAIGESNVTNQKVKSIVSGFLDPNDKEYEYKSNLLSDFLYQAEEQAISSKTSVKGLVSNKAQQWNEPISALMEGRGNRAKNLEKAETWLRNNLTGSLIPQHYLATSSSFAEKMSDKFNIITLEDMDNKLKTHSDEIYDVLMKDIIRVIDDASNNDRAGELYHSLKVATSSAGARHSIVSNLLFIDEQESNLKTVSEVMKKAFDVDMYDTVSRKALSNNSSAFRRSIEETISEATDNVGKVSTEAKIGGIIDGIGDFAKSVKGSNLAKGAIGIAAGIMVAGFVGGRPRPADVHAMEEASDYQTPMEGYQLADPGMMPGGTQQGYVININARTDKGRDNAARALQQAIASGGNANINIAMNITDNYGNINDRDIENAILGAL
nr:MAG TPA: hypothetical protein [Caudoviricetes sp.]